MDNFSASYAMYLLRSAYAGLRVGMVFATGYKWSLTLQNKYQFKSNPDIRVKAYVVLVGIAIYAACVTAIFFISSQLIRRTGLTVLEPILYGAFALFVIVWAFRSRFIPKLEKD